MSYAGKAVLDEWFPPIWHGFVDKRVTTSSRHAFETQQQLKTTVKTKGNIKELTGSWNTSESLQINFQIKTWFTSFDTVVFSFGTDIWRPGTFRIMR